tara:strand:- start:981 stop:1238 length:258 start_codon:yes stop_codon:yes gene_type:complete
MILPGDMAALSAVFHMRFADDSTAVYAPQSDAEPAGPTRNTPRKPNPLNKPPIQARSGEKFLYNARFSRDRTKANVSKSRPDHGL